MFSATLTKSVDYLLVGENAGSKLEKAVKLGVKVITVEDFLKMIEKS